MLRQKDRTDGINAKCLEHRFRIDVVEALLGLYLLRVQEACRNDDRINLAVLCNDLRARPDLLLVREVVSQRRYVSPKVRN